MLFGTDPDANVFGDVNRFDYGVDPLLAKYQEVSGQIRYLPNSVIETFIRARAPQDPRDRQPLETVNLSVKFYASRIGSAFKGILSWYKSDTRSRRVENEFEFIGELNEDERYRAHWDYLNRQLKELGGIDRIGFSYLPVDLKLELKDEPETVTSAPKIDAGGMSKKLEELLDAETYSTFVGLDDETYTWTEEEKAVILKQGKALFSELEEAVLLNILTHLEKAPRDLGKQGHGRTHR